MRTVLFKNRLASVIQETMDAPKEGQRSLTMKRSMMAITLTFAAAMLLLPVSIARSASMSTDFEAAPGSGYDLFYGAVQSTDFAHSGTYSIKLPMAIEADQPTVRMLPGDTLNNLNGSFWAYVPSVNNNVPYMIFGVDTNGNAVWDFGPSGDSMVIAFVNTPVTNDAWFLDGLDGSTLVHVVGNRSGLTAGTYDASGTQDTLANLRNMTVSGSTTWGDLNVQRAYIEAGSWPGVTSYTGYVDDMALTAVPEPGTMLLLGSGLVGLAGCGKRRFKN